MLCKHCVTYDIYEYLVYIVSFNKKIVEHYQIQVFCIVFKVLKTFSCFVFFKERLHMVLETSFLLLGCHCNYIALHIHLL